MKSLDPLSDPTLVQWVLSSSWCTTMPGLMWRNEFKQVQLIQMSCSYILQHVQAIALNVEQNIRLRSCQLSTPVPDYSSLSLPHKLARSAASDPDTALMSVSSLTRSHKASSE
ncbi:hypothetical protein NFI96_002655 [Prochilodus magdalenae]|nr:hypothetical protein NFI96_002655 [Prochilodus magdalenae]